MKLRIGWVVAALLVVCAAFTATIGDAAQGKTKPKPAKKPTVNVQANLQALYALAKPEGSVVWEVGAPTPMYQPLVDGFEKAYPGINVQTVRVPGTEVAGDVITAGSQVPYDVISSDPPNLIPLILRKLVAAPFWTNYGVPQSRIALGGQLLHAYDFPIAWFYNTDALQPSQLPKSWDDLVNGTWSGGTVMLSAQGPEGWEPEFINHTWNLAQYKAYVAKVKARGFSSAVNGATIIQAVASGQAKLGENAITQLPTFISQGAHIAIAPLGPVAVRPQGPVVLKYAHHPNAARLLALWLVSDDAEALWNSIGSGLAAPCGASQIADLLCKAGVKLTYIDTRSKAINYAALEAINIKTLGF